MVQLIKIVHFNNLLEFMKLIQGSFFFLFSYKSIHFLFCFFSLFTLDKSQCRGIDLQQEQISTNPYDEQSGILLKGDNLARMLALRSGTTMSNVERLADDMIMYGLIRYGKLIILFVQKNK